MRNHLSIRTLMLCLLATAMVAPGCGAANRPGAAAAERLPSAEPAGVQILASATPDAGVPATQPADPLAVRASAVDEPREAAPTASAPLDRSVEEKATAQPANLSAQFDLQLLRLLRNDLADTPGNLPQDERQVLTLVTDALTGFRRSAGDEKSRLATKIEPLADLSERLKTIYPMSIPTLALCRSVTQYGVYDPFDPPRFTAGKETPVIIYCELDRFASKPSSDGRFETKLSYEAVLYTDGDAGISVISKKPTSIVDRCRNRRRDFFLADRMTLPASLPVGRYLLKVTVIDQIANHVAERTLPIMIAPN